ncbi:hypothetical protein [Endozoicomonas arenosclerae]|uniref:hypothetical protein n=1 Tax=Endozoicomonas arenosclerae TaxID=1633495 RepID=UPI000786163C|nr:hypothetical protein [Endozoicomonas arenosclerae]
MKKVKLEVYQCARDYDIRQSIPGDMSTDEALYWWALIQQHADKKARANRRQWQVVQGSKPVKQPFTAEIQADGQMCWLF